MEKKDIHSETPDLKTNSMYKKQEKEIKCAKCQKLIPESTGIATKKGIICEKCNIKLEKQKRVVIACASVLALLLLGVGIYLVTSSKHYAGYEGAGNIIDSTKVTVSDVNQLSYIETTTAIRDTVSADGAIDNIESFNTAITQNIEKANKEKSSVVVLPSVSAMFEINTNYFTNNSENLIKEFAKIYNKTNKKAKLLIEGYTCNLGSNKLNDELSRVRAEKVKNMLINSGISQEYIEIKWYGKSKFNNFDYSNKSDYRRVILSVG